MLGSPHPYEKHSDDRCPGLTHGNNDYQQAPSLIVAFNSLSSYLHKVACPLFPFAAFAAKTEGWSLTPNNYEGVHVTCDATAGHGWALLRKSLHDPQQPLNIESEESGGVEQIAAKIKGFLSGYDGLDLPGM